MKKRSRRRLVVLVVLLLATFALALLPLGSRRVLEARLGVALGRPVRVGEVRYYVFPVEVKIFDLRVAGITADAPPFLEIPLIEVVPSVATLIGQSVTLSRVRIQGLKLRVNAPEGGGDDIPRGGGRGGGGGEVRIRRLVIEDGEFFLNHERVPLQLDLPDFHGRLMAKRGIALAGRISCGPGTLRFGTAPPLLTGTEIDVTVDGPIVKVDAGRVFTASAKTDLAYTGQIRIAKDPIGEFHLTGPADLGELDQHIFQTGFHMEGAGRFDGTLGVEGPRLRIKGHLEGTGGVFDGVTVPRYSGEVGKDEHGTHIHGLEVDALGGGGVLDIEVPPAPSIARLSARVHGADAEKLVAWIFKIGTPGVGASATGDVEIRWPRGKIRLLSGKVAFDLLPREDGRTPLHGRFLWSAEKGLQRVERADLRTPATWARLEGTIEADDRTDLGLDADSSDLEASDDLLARLRRALGSADARSVGFTGSGAFRGRWKGTLEVPLFEGRFSGQEVGYLGVVWGRAEWAGVAAPLEVRSHSLVLRRPGGEIWLDGRTETGGYGEHDAIDVRVRFDHWPAPDFTKVLDWDLDVTGLVSGETQVTGRRSAPEGRARVTCEEGRYYGIPYADLEVVSILKGDVTELTRGHARVGGGEVVFKGTATDDGVYDGTGRLSEVDVGDVLPPLAPDLRFGGRVSGDVAFEGTLLTPRVKGHLSSERIFLGDEGIGALSADVVGSGDGSLSVGSECRSPRVQLSLSGTLAAAAPHVAALKIRSQETSLDPFLRTLFPALPVQAGLVATGELTLRGPLLSPRELHMEAEVARLEVLLPEYRVSNPEAVRLAVDGGRLQVKGFHMAGEGTDLVVEGDAALLKDGPLALTVRGGADLRTLSLVTRRLRGRGAARLAMEVAGTRGAPRIDGRLDLDGAGLRARGFPHGFEDVRGSLAFSENGAHFEGVTSTLGGGEVEMEGHLAYREGRLLSFDVHGTGRGIALRYPEGLRTVTDADLRLYGDGARQWLSGAIDVRQAQWTRRYDVASELLAFSKPWEEEASLAEGLRYDVKIRAPGTLRIDNNLATLQATADLTLQGSYEAPVLVGRAEIDRGRVYFQGQTYVIRHGSIDFANPRRIDPFFDLEGETRIRSYRVTLKVNGTLERVSPTLTSDPPLTAVQILNLLAGADEATVASLYTTQTDQARLAATGAATLAAGRISEEVGLERGAERLFGLNRFSIDPSVVKGGVTNPTARLTVGKRITPDLNVLYSVDLRGGEERVLSVEYTLSDRFSLLLTRAEPGGYGFDLRLRETY